MALLGFGTIASSRSSNSSGYARKHVISIGISYHFFFFFVFFFCEQSFRRWPDGALIGSQDLHMIEDKMSDGANANDPIKLAIQNDIPNLSVFPSD